MLSNNHCSALYTVSNMNCLHPLLKPTTPASSGGEHRCRLRAQGSSSPTPGIVALQDQQDQAGSTAAGSGSGEGEQREESR